MGKSITDDRHREIMFVSDGKRVALHVNVDLDLHLFLNKKKIASLLKFCSDVTKGKESSLEL